VPGRVTIENLMEIPELTRFSADTDSFIGFFKLFPKPNVPGQISIKNVQFLARVVLFLGLASWLRGVTAPGHPG
jgi:hypothetical protein